MTDFGAGPLGLGAKHLSAIIPACYDLVSRRLDPA